MEIWTDGGCLDNGSSDAVGAWAFVAENGHEESGRLERTTNNRAELIAIIRAIEYASSIGQTSVIVYSDSMLCVKCGNGLWKRKANLDLWEVFFKVRRSVKEAKLVWVKGHSGITQNERCDELCRMEMAGPSVVELTEEQRRHIRSICG